MILVPTLDKLFAHLSSNSPHHCLGLKISLRKETAKCGISSLKRHCLREKLSTLQQVNLGSVLKGMTHHTIVALSSDSQATQLCFLPLLSPPPPQSCIRIPRQTEANSAFQLKRKRTSKNLHCLCNAIIRNKRPLTRSPLSPFAPGSPCEEN